jgi:hypothetical protein
MRDIEEMSTADTAAALELSEDDVKIRLHRARLLLRVELVARAGPSRGNVFPFPAHAAIESCELCWRGLEVEVSVASGSRILRPVSHLSKLRKAGPSNLKRCFLTEM